MPVCGRLSGTGDLLRGVLPNTVAIMSGKFGLTTILGGLAQSRKAPINFVMSVRPSACISAASTGKLFEKLWVQNLNTNLSTKSKFPSNRRKCRTLNMSALAGCSLLLPAVLSRHTSASGYYNSRRGTDITRTRTNVTFYLYSPFCHYVPPTSKNLSTNQNYCPSSFQA